MLTKRIESRWHRFPRLAPFHFAGQTYERCADACAQARLVHDETYPHQDVTVTDRDGAPVFTIKTETFNGTEE